MTTTFKRRDWYAHDAAVPFRDTRLARLNGTNPTGRRPRVLSQPERKPLYAALAANNNQQRDDAAA